MAALRGGEYLRDELAALAAVGVGTMVSLLTTAEEWTLDLAGEQDLAQAAGIDFMRLPTVDRGLPTLGPTHRLSRQLVARLDRGDTVAIHCRAGIGRASLLAACVLVQEGTPADDVWQRITDARGLLVPDTDQQREWVVTFASYARSKCTTGTDE